MGETKKPKRYSHTQICCVSLFVFFGDVSFCWVLFLLSLFHFTILSSPGQKPPKYYCTHTKNLICVLTTTDSTANEEKTSNERKKRLYKELYLKNNFARDFFSSFSHFFLLVDRRHRQNTERERERMYSIRNGWKVLTLFTQKWLFSKRKKYFLLIQPKKTLIREKVEKNT